MTSLEDYRYADYDIDLNFDKTTSWPGGLHEVYRFEPNLPRAVRRTSSAEDIQRYKDHFSIAHKNQGELLTWKHYLKILADDLRHFETHVLMSKALLERLASPRDSETSQYITASESELFEKSPPRFKKNKKNFVNTEKVGDTDSVSSVACISINSISSVADSNVSLSPQKNLLKKFLSDVHQLAIKTYKTVEKMSVKPKYCSACGDYISKVKAYKDCSQPLINVFNYKKPTTPSMLKNTKFSRIFSNTSLNLVTSFGSGESATNPQTAEKVPASYKKKVFYKRMLPFTKENSTDIKN